MGCYTGERIEAAFNLIRIEIDGRGIGVLHAAARGSAGKMIEERVAVEWPIIHPTDRAGNDFVESGNDFLRIVVSGIGVDDDTEMASGFVEVRFLKLTDLHGRVDETVVVVRVE